MMVAIRCKFGDCSESIEHDSESVVLGDVSEPYDDALSSWLYKYGYSETATYSVTRDKTRYH